MQLCFLQMVERHKGLTTSLKRNRQEMSDQLLKQELRAAIKSALYKICTTFGDSILDASSLDADVRKKIESFRTFAEC